MFYNYLKITIRNISRYRIFSLVNVLGLAFGIAISIIIYVFIRQELSYDKYHENHKRIFRVNTKVEAFETRFKSSMTPYRLGETLKEDFPGVEESVRVLEGSHKKVSYNDKHFSAKRFYYTDPSFFRIFTVPIIKSDTKDLLAEENTIIITEETAELYFGKEDPVGQFLYLDNGWKFRITGVCENVPANSHLHFDFLASMKGIFTGKDVDMWSVNPVTTYIMLKEDIKPYMLQNVLDKIAQEKTYPELAGLYPEETAAAKKDLFRFYLQPLADLHFTTDVLNQFEAGRQKIYLYIFSVLAGIILLIACVNYMNLSTARLSTRAREVALRKVVGSSRSQIIIQFLAESVFFSILATFIAMVVIELIARPFLMISGISIDPTGYRQWYLIPILLGGTFLVGMLSGSYPAFFLSGFGILKIMKGGNLRGDGNARFRGILVLVQFTLSIIMVISTLVIYYQVRYMQQKNLGFNKNNILVIQRAYALGKEGIKFTELLKKNPDIVNASFALSMPGEISEKVPLVYEEGGYRKTVYFSLMAADTEFIETMQMHLIQGNNFNCSGTEKSKWCLLINECASKELGLKNPVGSKLHYAGSKSEGDEFMITGVVKDYHFESLYKEIKPILIYQISPEQHIQTLAVRITGRDIPKTIDYIGKVWGKVTNNEPFDYYFLNKDLDMLYKEEERTAGIFGIFSFLAIFIATLGLFGLAAHTAELRTREIGIRKAMGASVRRITLMLLAHFTRWVLWSVLVAFPIAYLIMKLWLARFAYHINIEIWFFIVAAVIAVIIAIFTVSFQSFKSARANPLQALQYE